MIADPQQSEPSSVVLSGAQVREIIYSLHSVDGEPCEQIDTMPNERLGAVWKWICKDPVHPREWHSLKAAFDH